MKSLNEVQTIHDQTLRLLELYSSHNLPIPFGLKGNLGEFYVLMELIKRYPHLQPDFRGGSFPDVDILIDGFKIQVKTQIKHPRTEFRGGFFDFESSPTIKSATIKEQRVDFIILVIIYEEEGYSHVTKRNVYIFDQNDFKHFSNILCWSGKSRRDYTIVNVLELNGTPPKKLGEKIAHYRTEQYKRVFDEAKDNWGKIDRALKASSRNNRALIF